MARVKCLHDELPLSEYNKIEKTCKMCGKKYYEAWTKSGYSDFCSRECSRGYSTKAKRQEINENLSKKLENNFKKKYIENPKKCLICGNNIPYEKKKCKCCSKECFIKLLSNRAKELNNIGKLCGGYRKGSSRGKGGYYKGIWCDSTFELAFLVYNIDHKVDIKRCKRYFIYEINGKERKYFPDFEINGKIIEIKNYWRKEVDLKMSAVKNAGYEINVLYQHDLEIMMKYIDNHYNLWHKKKNNNYHKLYDK